MTYDSCSYPQFLQMRAAVKDQAESVAVSYAEHIDLTYGRDADMEKAYRQFVSGWMFDSFGLRPALGRLLNKSDDETPGAHPVAVLSYDYWTRRLAQDRNVAGRTFRMDGMLYQIIGVAEERFTGTETGTVTDVFVPMTMKNPRNPCQFGNFWLRTLVRIEAGRCRPNPFARGCARPFTPSSRREPRAFWACPNGGWSDSSRRNSCSNRPAPAVRTCRETTAGRCLRWAFW